MLLLAFPLLVVGTVFAVVFFLNYDFNYSPGYYSSSYSADYEPMDRVMDVFIPSLIGSLIIVAIWFTVAFFAHSKIINAASKSKTLTRKENMRVYNLTENLCMSVGMTMPNLRVIESDALNAFASGLNQKSYTVTLTRGIIEKLNDEELEGVIAHELMHIRNKDVRLLVVSIIFVGIFSFAVQVAFRSVLYGGLSRNRKKSDGKAMLVILVVVLVAYLLSILFKFSLSRKREYLADSGAAEMTKNPHALANALKKIAGNHEVDVDSGDIKQMFIENAPGKDDKMNLMGKLGGLFATHPPIEKRIKILEQF